MSRPCLRDIEKTMRVLWMNRKAREKFLDGQYAAVSGDISQDLLSQIDPKGVKLYSSLISWGQKDLMRSVYPGCARLLGDKWIDYLEKYLEVYPPRYYNLNQCSKHFPEFLEKHAEAAVRKYPYIVELAHYEWLELELMESALHGQLEPFELPGQPAQFASFMPVLNPVAKLVSYCYPIAEIVEHLQNECCLPKDVQPQDCYMLVVRCPQTQRCRFLELQKSAASLLNLGLKQPMSYQQWLALAVELSAGSPVEQAVSDCLELFERLKDIHFFVGSQLLPAQ
jgi:uncharacterized protein